MEQLYQEMSELRKSIAGCIEMQVKLQHSIKEEVSAVVNNLKSEIQNPTSLCDSVLNFIMSSNIHSSK